jgi:hypothetical protein
MGIECAYPPRKPGCFALIQDSASDLENSPLILNRANALSMPSFIDDVNTTTSAALPLDLNPIPYNSLLDQPRPVWFLMPETWQIDHGPMEGVNSSSFYNIDIMRLLLDIQGWLKTWTKTGCNPFIHSHLYHARFPGCLQIAYTTLSSYINRTDSTTDIILRVVNEQARVLIVNNEIKEDGQDQINGIATAGQFDTLEQLARVHALLVYQSIGLFDRDIRTRHLAEGRISVLDRWANEMVESASSIELPSFIDDSFDSRDVTLSNMFDDNTESTWHTWILTESARRTWRITRGFQTLFRILQQGWTHCPGAMYITTRQGLWDASTASEWEKLCSEVDVGFIKRFDNQDVFLLNPQDIDEFGTLILESTYSSEKLRRWKVEKNMSDLLRSHV